MNICRGGHWPPDEKSKKGDQWSPLRKFLSYATVLSTSLFLSTKSFQFSVTSHKAPLEGSCRHRRLRGGSLLNFNHTNGRPMVVPTHVPLKQQRTPIMQAGDQWSPLHTFHSNNSELQSRKQATTGCPYTRSTQTTANSNHANGRPPVATTHVPLKQQRTPITQKGRPPVATTTQLFIFMKVSVNRINQSTDQQNSYVYGKSNKHNTTSF